MFRRIANQLINLKHVEEIECLPSKKRIRYTYSHKTFLVIAGSGGTDTRCAYEYFTSEEDTKVAYEALCKSLLSQPEASKKCCKPQMK